MKEVGGGDGRRKRSKEGGDKKAVSNSRLRRKRWKTEAFTSISRDRRRSVLPLLQAIGSKTEAFASYSRDGRRKHSPLIYEERSISTSRWDSKSFHEGWGGEKKEYLCRNNQELQEETLLYTTLLYTAPHCTVQNPKERNHA